MLNERIEFDQYTFDINTYNPANPETVKPRLNHKNICNSLSGIDRAMTVIARYYYYNYYNAASNKQPSKNERIAFVEKILKTWCGSSKQHPEKLVHLQSWLPKYIKEVLMADKLRNLYTLIDLLPDSDQQVDLELCIGELRSSEDTEMRQRAIDTLYELTAKYPKYQEMVQSVQRQEFSLIRLKGKKTSFAKKMFSVKVSDEEASRWNNDFKKITYESIIANAIDKGPLTTKFLAFKIDPFSHELVKKARGKISPADTDRIQKMLAAFLLGRTNDQQEFAVINKADISNWCEDDPKMDKGDYEKYLFDRKPLFTVKLIGNNVNKLAVPKAFLDLVNPTLCNSEDEVKKMLNEGYTVYKDNGAGKKLELISM